jgi:enoyl-[acyl-carrier protein] reductase II
MANAFKAIRIATENGDNEKGVLTVGQVTGLVRDIPTVAELMERIVAEAAAVRERLNTAIAGS